MSYPQPYELDQSKPNIIVVTCVDWRLHQGTYESVIEELGVEYSDRISMAGPDKRLAEGDEAVINEIGSVAELHHCSEVRIIGHIACGMYGGLEAFGGDIQKETKAHFSNFGPAENNLKTALPRLSKVELHLVGPDGELISKSS
jgi:hypothetical protein